jgi:hypothetical protein
MNPRDHFDLTPQQYHGGLDKLWTALGLTGVQNEDVFTLAARAIETGKTMERWARCQYLHGPLKRVLLYPCHCGRLTIDEWYMSVVGWHKEVSVIEVADLHEARVFYRRIFGALLESHYIPATDTYTSKSGMDNFIVTGSHCTCKECRS